MCLAVPGKVICIDKTDPFLPMAKVMFGGVTREVCIAYVPEVKENDFVIVHVGFALSILNPDEATTILEDVQRLELL